MGERTNRLELSDLPNGWASFFVDSNYFEKTANYTVVIDTDSGKTFVSKLDGIVFTLPSIGIGNTITFVNVAPNGTAEMSISPAALDNIVYVGDATDDKDLINTKATAKRGDYVTLASQSSATGWEVIASRGIWAKEA